MQKAKEYKELYVSEDEYYIMDDDIEYDIDNNNLEKPFINYVINDDNNDGDNDDDDKINDFNKITENTFVITNNKIEACEIGTNTDKIMCDKSTITEQNVFVNNTLANSISSDMGCGKIFKCMCVIS